MSLLGLPITIHTCLTHILLAVMTLAFLCIPNRKRHQITCGIVCMRAALVTHQHRIQCKRMSFRILNKRFHQQCIAKE